MPIWEAVLLGIVQGVTEFLPVSSSGHLALAQLLLPGFRQPGLVFDVALHLGTVVSVLVLERERIVAAVRERYAWRLAMLLGGATVATAAVALPLRQPVEAAFTRPLVVAAGFVVTAVLLLVMPRLASGHDLRSLPWGTAVIVGAVQGVAVVPGLSRSGSTIAAATMCGVDRRWAADFSFLLSVPAVLGAALVEVWSHREALAAEGNGLLWPCLVGAAVAAVTGGVAIAVVRQLVRHGRLRVFAFYLLPLAAVVAAVVLLGGS